jgi:rod shape-determining protein MreB
MARREHGVLLGHEDIQLLKQRFLNLKTTENKSKTLTGQSSIQGTPKKVTIKQKQLQSYLELPLEQIVQHFKMVLEQCPPDIISDIAQHGVVLSGGSAQIKGLSDYLSKRLHLACVVADSPELCSIKGAYSALSHLDEYRKSLLS